MSSDNRHIVYLRDWYFNAGLVGFLRLIQPFHDQPKSLTIGSNSIEFSNDVFAGFEERLKKEVFFTYFKLSPYIKKLTTARTEIEKELQKTGKKSAPKKWIESLTKFPYRGFSNALDIGFDDNPDLNNLLRNIDCNITELQGKTPERLHKLLLATDRGREYLDTFITFKLKGFCAIKDVTKFVSDIQTMTYTGKTLKPNQCCLSCQNQHRKATVELSNAISNIIGFNSDNANWVWAYQSGNIRVCSLCALIYISSIAGFTYTTYLDNGNWLDAYYIVNDNSSIRTLLDATNGIKSVVSENNNSFDGKTFYQVIKHMMMSLKHTQASRHFDGHHVIEVIQNPILGGQSSKGYNIYNYNLDANTSLFLKHTIENIPKGWYKAGDTSIDLQMELLKKVIGNTLLRQDLHRYALYRIQELHKRKGLSGYDLGHVIRFSFMFWKAKKGEKNMGDTSQTKIYENGRGAGNDLRVALRNNSKENQIPGIAHSLLNALKIEDRERFLDDYFRLVLRYGLSMRVYKREMVDMDDFLQFGYAFLSALIQKESNKSSDKSDTQTQEEN